MKKLSYWALACSAMFWGASAPAQSLAISADNMVQASVSVIQMLENKQAADVWEAAASAAKSALAKEAFVASVAQAQKESGPVLVRDWTAVRRKSIGPGGETPEGQYVSVEFEAVFADQQAVRELVTFHLESDRVWRFSGYFQQPAGAVAQ